MPETSKAGLALSGGGFRATLFHLGSVWRLNEMAMLPELDTISAVSGGAILAGVLAVGWPNLNFQNGIAVNFQQEIAEPTWKFCSQTIDIPAALLGIFCGTRQLEKSYRQIVGTARLKDMPDYPRFIFNAGHIETGRNCTISKHGIHTWRLGDAPMPDLPIAKAIAASSACPPFFPPITLKLDPATFTRSEYSDLFHRDDLKEKLTLTDGGAYDNIGYHAIRNHQTVLISDAGAPLSANHSNRLKRQIDHRILRPMQTAVEQTRALRRNYILEQLQNNEKQGATWHITTELRRYPLVSPLQVPKDWSYRLPKVRTRLNSFTDTEKSDLINWGYLLSDLSIRSYYREDALPPETFPYP